MLAKKMIIQKILSNNSMDSVVDQYNSKKLAMDQKATGNDTKKTFPQEVQRWMVQSISFTGKLMTLSTAKTKSPTMSLYLPQQPHLLLLVLLQLALPFKSLLQV